jgi:hypothetical protein
MIATSPPAWRVSGGQLGDRVDLERGADAQQHVGAGGEREGALQRALGQELAEQHDVGLQRVVLVAARHAVRRGRKARADVLEADLLAARQARRVVDRPVDLDELLGPGRPMQAVDVLGDDGVEVPAALELDQRVVRAVGLLVSSVWNRSP